MHPWPDCVCAWLSRNSLYIRLPCDSEETVCGFLCTHMSTVLWRCHRVAVLHWETIGLPREPGCQGMDHLSSSTALMINRKGAFFHRISMAVIACDRNGFPVTPWLYEETLGILSRFFFPHIAACAHTPLFVPMGGLLRRSMDLINLDGPL